MAFHSAREYLASESSDQPGCLVLDVAMPFLDGLQLQEALFCAGHSLPVIFLTGHGDIPMSVRAMKNGAVDFLTKPCRDQDLIAAIRQALTKNWQARELQAGRKKLNDLLASLTPREREVMTGVVAGKLNKQIATELGIGEKTIKVHRARVMQKLAVKSVADLVRLSEAAFLNGGP